MQNDRPKGPHQGAKIGFQGRIRRGAFFDAAWAAGCRNWSVYNRTYISGVFSDPVSEYWQVVNKVAVWPVMGERQVEITGPDTKRFIQYLTPRDLSDCKIGQCKYVLLTNAAGGILCDPILCKLSEDRYWLSTSDIDVELWAAGVAQGGGFDVSVRDANVSLIQVQGPKSPLVLAGLFGDAVLDLKNYWFMEVTFQGQTLWVSRTGWSGEFGYEVYVADPNLGTPLFEALMEAGAPWDIAPGSVNHAKRIEAGILSQGVDMTPDDSPFEVGLGRLVQLHPDRPCVGYDALAKAASVPPARWIVGLGVDGPALLPNETRWPLHREGQVGWLTSLAHSPRLARNIALGVVNASDATQGTVLDVMTWDGPRKATVEALPFTPKRSGGNARDLLES
ncbi:MAG: glycine cleavage T C-terminal barrel domain-containing protein [Pseudomonadota bacterium]